MPLNTKKGRDRGTSRMSLSVFLTGSVLIMIVLAACSILFGSTKISLPDITAAFLHPDLSNHAQLAIRELRVPRTLADILVGAAFAVSGAIMQGVTRNPLADSGLLGLNAGASFMLALALAFLPGLGFGWMVLLSFLGAALAMAAVYGLLRLGRRKSDPVRLVLAGSAISLFLSALCQGIALYYNIGQDLTFWTSGGVAGVRMAQIKIAGPILLAGLLAAVVASKKVALLSLGDEAAAGLGVDLEKSRLLCLLIVLVLAGTSVALAGLIAFAGLLVPYIVRYFTGGSYTSVIAGCLTAGPCFMLAADLISRLVNAPSETPIGLIFSLIGVPVFIWAARREDWS